MAPPIKNLKGRVSGRLTVLRLVGRSKTRHALWECQCKCGNTLVVEGYRLTRTNEPIRSCGCHGREMYGQHSVTHGHSRGGHISSTYSSWEAMQARCLCITNKDYPRYGGVGVGIYEPWLGFDNFLHDVGPRPAGTTLSRLADSGNYMPGNVVWGTQSHQIRQRRLKRKGGYFGEAM